MVKNNTVCIDSNFFIALYNPTDTLHTKAKEIAKQLQYDNPRICISSAIFLETVTVLSQRVNRTIASKAGNKLLQTEQFIYLDEPLYRMSWEIFQQIPKKNVSFVDCSILAIIQQEDIHSLITFDKEDFLPLQKPYKFTIYSL